MCFLGAWGITLAHWKILQFGCLEGTKNWLDIDVSYSVSMASRNACLKLQEA